MTSTATRDVTSPLTLAACTRSDPHRWPLFSLVIALVAAVGSALGLTFVDSIYGQETTVFADQAIAQDLVNLFLVAPLLAYSGWRAMYGSLPAYLAWLGFLTFTVYNYAIYTFAIHSGPLFLLWVAVFGASLFTLIAGGVLLDPDAVADAFGHRPARWTAGFLIGAGTLFTLLWLSDVVPALLDGTAPKAAVEVALPTNPVHVLDLAVFLPAVFAVGVSLWRRRPLGYSAAPAMLLFLAVTGLPILTTVFVASARGHEAAWGLLVPIGALTVASLALAWQALHPRKPSS